MSSKKKSSFRKNLGVVTTASLLSFAISLALSPVMTRWYQPDDYGIFAIINNTSIFISTAFLLSLPNTLPVVLACHRRAQLLRALLTLALLSVAFSSAGVGGYLLWKSISSQLKAGDWVFVAIPVLVFVIALQRISQNWANADGDFRSMAIARVVHPLIAKPFAIIASMLTTSSPFYLLFFEAVGYSCQSLTMLSNRNRMIGSWTNFISSRRLKLTFGVARRHHQFAIYLNMVNLLTLGAITLQTIIIASSYSVHETGLYTLAVSMTGLPIQLVAIATAPVIYHKLIDIYNNQPSAFFKKMFKLFSGFLLVGILPYLFLYMYGDILFGFVFGEKWTMSGSVASLLSIPFCLQFIYTAISSAFRVTSSMKTQFIVDASFISSVVITLFFTSKIYEFQDAIFCFSVALTFQYIASISSCLAVAWRASCQIDGAQKE